MRWQQYERVLELRHVAPLHIRERRVLYYSPRLAELPQADLVLLLSDVIYESRAKRERREVVLQRLQELPLRRCPRRRRVRAYHEVAQVVALVVDAALSSCAERFARIELAFFHPLGAANAVDVILHSKYNWSKSVQKTSHAFTFKIQLNIIQ